MRSRDIEVQWPGWSSRRRRQHEVHREARFSGDPVERLVGRVVFRARSIRERSALLTASPFGNTRATSGVRTMILEASFIRFAYFPRTSPPGKSERLYSGRNSSFLDFLSFFIKFQFSLTRFASAYNSNFFVFFSMRYHQKPTFFRNTKGNITLLIY